MSKSAPQPQALERSPLRPVPPWLRQMLRNPDPAAAYTAAGAAIALLDEAARDSRAPARLWQQRLAMSAALAVAKFEGRREDEAALRDSALFTAPGDDPGPAGRLYRGWRKLPKTGSPTAKDWAGLLQDFDLKAQSDLDPLLAEVMRLTTRGSPIHYAADIAWKVMALGPSYRGFSLWLADFALARALGWPQPLPLLASALPRAAFRISEPALWAKSVAIAYAEAAIDALALRRDLIPRADALLQFGQKMRGKDSAALLQSLLMEDAVLARAGAHASDRAARRAFERLTALGLVRELSGRSSFRCYGL